MQKPQGQRAILKFDRLPTETVPRIWFEKRKLRGDPAYIKAAFYRRIAMITFQADQYTFLFFSPLWFFFPLALCLTSEFHFNFESTLESPLFFLRASSWRFFVLFFVSIFYSRVLQRRIFYDVRVRWVFLFWKKLREQNYSLSFGVELSKGIQFNKSSSLNGRLFASAHRCVSMSRVRTPNNTMCNR